MRCYLVEIFIQTMRRINKVDTNALYNDYSKMNYTSAYIVKTYIYNKGIKKIILLQLLAARQF